MDLICWIVIRNHINVHHRLMHIKHKLCFRKLELVANSVDPNEFLQWDEQVLKVTREQCIAVA